MGIIMPHLRFIARGFFLYNFAGTAWMAAFIPSARYLQLLPLSPAIPAIYSQNSEFISLNKADTLKYSKLGGRKAEKINKQMGYCCSKICMQ